MHEKNEKDPSSRACVKKMEREKTLTSATCLLVVLEIITSAEGLNLPAMNRLFGRIFGSVQDASTRAIYGVEQVSTAMSFYTLVDRDMSGNEIEMSKYSGNVLLLVNVASK